MVAERGRPMRDIVVCGIPVTLTTLLEAEAIGLDESRLVLDERPGDSANTLVIVSGATLAGPLVWPAFTMTVSGNRALCWSH